VDPVPPIPHAPHAGARKIGALEIEARGQQANELARIDEAVTGLCAQLAAELRLDRGYRA
jgi:hypothetical protein